jgi:hypothetical protein
MSLGRPVKRWLQVKNKLRHRELGVLSVGKSILRGRGGNILSASYVLRHRNPFTISGHYGAILSLHMTQLTRFLYVISATIRQIGYVGRKEQLGGCLTIGRENM